MPASPSEAWREPQEPKQGCPQGAGGPAPGRSCRVPYRPLSRSCSYSMRGVVCSIGERGRGERQTQGDRGYAITCRPLILLCYMGQRARAGQRNGRPSLPSLQGPFLSPQGPPGAARPTPMQAVCTQPSLPPPTCLPPPCPGLSPAVSHTLPSYQPWVWPLPQISPCPALLQGSLWGWEPSLTLSLP